MDAATRLVQRLASPTTATPLCVANGEGLYIIIGKGMTVKKLDNRGLKPLNMQTPKTPHLANLGQHNSVESGGYYNMNSSPAQLIHLRLGMEKTTRSPSFSLNSDPVIGVAVLIKTFRWLGAWVKSKPTT